MRNGLNILLCPWWSVPWCPVFFLGIRLIQPSRSGNPWPVIGQTWVGCRLARRLLSVDSCADKLSLTSLSASDMAIEGMNTLSENDWPASHGCSAGKLSVKLLTTPPHTSGHNHHVLPAQSTLQDNILAKVIVFHLHTVFDTVLKIIVKTLGTMF